LVLVELPHQVIHPLVVEVLLPLLVEVVVLLQQLPLAEVVVEPLVQLYTY
jgi:hypothetical protein